MRPFDRVFVSLCLRIRRMDAGTTVKIRCLRDEVPFYCLAYEDDPNVPIGCGKSTLRLFGMIIYESRWPMNVREIEVSNRTRPEPHVTILDAPACVPDLSVKLVFVSAHQRSSFKDAISKISFHTGTYIGPRTMGL